MNKRQQLGAESREKILDAAERLLSQRGYTGTTISQLSKDSGLPAASIYWHFTNKVGVLAAVLDRRSDAVIEEMLDATVEVDDPFDALSQFIQRGAAATVKYPDFFRLVAFMSMESNDETAQIAPTIQGIHDRAVSALNEGLVRIFQPRTPAEHAATSDLAELARSMYLGSVVLSPTQGDTPFNRARRAYVELVQCALEKQRSRPQTKNKKPARKATA
jgi:AcrR family transcriptional regulator